MSTTTAPRRRRRTAVAAAPALQGGALLASSSSGRVAGELRHLPLDAIDPLLNPNPRGDVDTTTEAFAAFLESIRASGVLQPVGAHPHPDDPERVALTMGWRRYTAATIAGLETIPVYVTGLTGSALVRAIAENSAREDLTPLQEAHAIKTLMDEEGLNQVDAGKLIGRSERTVRERLRLLKVPPVVAAAINEGTIPAYAGPVMQRIGETCPRFAEHLTEAFRGGEIAGGDLNDGDYVGDLLAEAQHAQVPVQEVGGEMYVQEAGLPERAKQAIADLTPMERNHLRWDSRDEKAARKAGVLAEFDVKTYRGPSTMGLVEDEQWLAERIAVVAKRAKKEAEAQAAAAAEIKRLREEGTGGDDDAAREAEEREEGARLARRVRAAHAMNLELGRQILAHRPDPGEVAPLLAVVALAKDATRAAAAAAALIDPASHELVLMGPDDRFDKVKVPTFDHVGKQMRRRVHEAADDDKPRVLLAGLLAALWADPRSAWPNATPVGHSWTYNEHRLPTDVHELVAAYAAKHGLDQPARMRALDEAIAEYERLTKQRDVEREELRLLHELTVTDDGLDGETLLGRAAGHAYGLGPGVATHVPKSRGVERLADLIERQDITTVDGAGRIAIADQGRERFKAGATAPEPVLRDIDEHLPLVYPPAADDPAEEGELVLEGRTRGEQALSAIRQRPGITIPELAEALGVKQNYLYRVLPALEQDGKVVKRGRGWHLAEEGTTDA